MNIFQAQQCLHFFRWLKRPSLPPPILTTFYRGTIESVLTSCITVWYGNCSAADNKTLQRTVNTAAKILCASLPSILDIFLTRWSSKANSIMKDSTHPSHSLFQLLPSGIRYRSIRDCSTALSPRLWEPWTLWNPIQTPYLLKHGPLHPTWTILSAHVQYSFEAFVQFVYFVFFCLCISKSVSWLVVYRFIVFFFTSLLYVCMYVAPWSCEARCYVPLYVLTCSGMTIKLNLTWLYEHRMNSENFSGNFFLHISMTNSVPIYLNSSQTQAYIQYL